MTCAYNVSSIIGDCRWVCGVALATCVVGYSMHLLRYSRVANDNDCEACKNQVTHNHWYNTATEVMRNNLCVF